MNERETLAALLDMIETRKGDMWWDECCTNCYHEDWHRDRFGPDVGAVAGEDMWKAKVPKCECPCHEARRILGREDRIHDPRWQTP